MISSTTTVDSHWCDGGTDYAVTIEFLDDPSNLYVVVLDYLTSVETILTYTAATAGTGEFSYDSATGDITTGDTFTGTGSEGASDKITITTELDYLQETDITSNSNYDPEVLETAYDNAVMLTRQNKDSIGRSISLAISDTGETMTLPAKASLANSYLHFDASGDPEAQTGPLPKVYDDEYAYSTNDIIQYSGKFFIALQATTGDTPTGGSTDVYWKMLNFDGMNWDATMYFNTGDNVEYGGYLYKSIADDNINHTPTYPDGDAYWTRVFTKGDSGDIDVYDETVNYGIDTVRSYGGDIYISLQGSNLDNQPDTSPLWWQVWPKAVVSDGITFESVTVPRILIGTGLATGLTGFYGIAALDATHLAFIESSAGTLRTYLWNTLTRVWTLDGAALAVSMGTPAITALDSTHIAMIDTTNEELRTYVWNGSAWLLDGSGFAITGAGVCALATLDSTHVAFIDDTLESLRTYVWSGSTWSLVGSGLTITGCGYPDLTALDSTHVAATLAGLDELRTYLWNGSIWVEEGTGLALPGMEYASIVATDSSHIIYIERVQEQMEAYGWDESAWKPMGPIISLPGIGSGAITLMDTNHIAHVDADLDILGMYRCEYILIGS